MCLVFIKLLSFFAEAGCNLDPWQASSMVFRWLVALQMARGALETLF